MLKAIRGTPRERGSSDDPHGVTAADSRAIAALARRARDLVEHPEQDRADFLRRKAEVVARVERDL